MILFAYTGFQYYFTSPLERSELLFSAILGEVK